MSKAFSFKLIKGTNGYDYYEIPKGTLLYRGDTNLYPRFQVPDGPAFFSTAPMFVKHYGLLFTFETTMPLKLLALDTKVDYSLFYENAPADVRKILDRNYGRTSGQRETVYDQDYKLVNYLCSIGFDGYANDRMDVTFDSVVDMYDGEEEEEDRKFHPEMAICDTTKIKFVEPKKDMSRYTQSEIDRALLKKQADKQKRELDEQRKQKTRKRNPRYDEREQPTGTSIDAFEPVPSSSGLFQANNYNSPPSSPTSQNTPSIFSLLDEEGATTSDSAGSDVSAPSTPPRAMSFASTSFNSPSNTPPKRQKQTYYGGKRKTKNKRRHKIKKHTTRKKVGGGILGSMVTLKNMKLRKELEDRLRTKCNDGEWLDKKRKAYGFVGGSAKHRNKKTIRKHRKSNKKKRTYKRH